MQSTPTCDYVAIKLLKHGHEIGMNQIPSNWLSSRKFQEFLDSRVNYDGEDLVEVDCSFLLHTHTKKYQIKCMDDVDTKLLF